MTNQTSHDTLNNPVEPTTLPNTETPLPNPGIVTEETAANELPLVMNTNEKVHIQNQNCM